MWHDGSHALPRDSIAFKSDICRVGSPLLELFRRETRVHRSCRTSDVPSKVQMMVSVLETNLKSYLIQRSICQLAFELLKFFSRLRYIAPNDFRIERFSSCHCHCYLLISSTLCHHRHLPIHPPRHPRIQHIQRQAAAAQDFVVEGALVEFVAQLLRCLRA